MPATRDSRIAERHPHRYKEGCPVSATPCSDFSRLDALFARTRTNPAYGHLWRLNGSDWTVRSALAAQREEGAYVPAAPADMVAAMGALDRKLFIVPSRKLIVVRTGQAAPDKDVNNRLWQLLARAMPGG